MKRRVPIACKVCGVTNSVIVASVNAALKEKGYYRCRSCSNTERNVALARPIGATRIHKQSGYIEEKSLNGEWRRQHMLLIEQKIGRRLLPNEDVHHKNGIKTDNRLENLELMTHAGHTAEHNRGKIFSKERKENIRNGIANAKGIKTNKAVCESIRNEYESGKFTQREIADKYGISRTAVHRAIYRKIWE